MPVTDVLLVAAVLTATWVGLVSRAPRTRTTAACSALAGALLAASLLGDGARWQWVLLVVGLTSGAGAQLVRVARVARVARLVRVGRDATGAGRGIEGRGIEGRGIEGRGIEGRGIEGRWGWVLMALLAGLSTLSTALAGAALWALPRVQLPEPSGPYEVGTSVATWTDTARPETATTDPGDDRAVVVQAWYPADGSSGDGVRARYLGRTAAESRAVARGLADLFGAPAFLLQGAERGRATATPDAEPAVESGGFPVVLFSPGLGGVRTQSTAWAEDLASHGYVVVGVDHPYDSAAVVVEGRVVRSRLVATGDDAEDQARADEAVSTRAADLSFVLTQLSRLDRLDRLGSGDAWRRLAPALDVGRVAVVGHSLGGAAALVVGQDDPRVDAVVDVDGLPRGLDDRPLRQPVLALVAGRGTGDEAGDARYEARLDEALRLARAPSHRVEVTGAAHLTFTDAPLYLPPLPSLVGSLGAEESLAVTVRATRAFLDSHLRTPDARLEDRLGELGEVRSYG